MMHRALGLWRDMRPARLVYRAWTSLFHSERVRPRVRPRDSTLQSRRCGSNQGPHPRDEPHATREPCARAAGSTRRGAWDAESNGALCRARTTSTREGRPMNVLSALRSSILAVISISAAAQTAVADSEAALPFTIRRVVASGDPVPGSPGEFFEHFGTRDGLGFLLSPPRIDRIGGVHFTALLGTDGDPDTIEEQFPEVFRSVGGVIETVARIGDAAPGISAATFTSFPSEFGHTPGAHSGRTTFVGSTDFGLTFGLWSDRFGPIEAVLLPGQVMPDTPPDS